ncbi:MAG: tetratricopeptide repeat protein [Cyanobacteriota bacterium]
MLSQKQFDQAIQIFNDLLSDDPNDPEALVGLASAYQHKNKPDEAIKLAEKALESNPSYHYAYDVLSEIYFINKSNYLKAEEYALKSLQIDPFSSSTYSLLAQIYYFQKYFPQCHEYATKALNLDPLNYVAHMALGLYYCHVPDYEKAEEHYKACLSIAPESSVAYGNYGLLNLAFAQNKMGYNLLREAVRLNPDDRFLQESFREAYIRNNPFYAPLYWITKGVFDDVYIIYANVIFMFIVGFTAQLPFITGLLKVLLIIIFIFNLGSLLTMVIYRFIMRFFINRFYSWHIKKGALHKII